MKKLLTTSALTTFALLSPKIVEAQEVSKETTNTYDYKLRAVYQNFDEEVSETYEKANEETDEEVNFKAYYDAIQQRKDVFKKIENLNVLIKTLDLNSELGSFISNKLIENTKKQVESICKNNPLLEKEFMMETQSTIYFIALEASMITTNNDNKNRVDSLYSIYFNENTIRQIKGF